MAWAVTWLCEHLRLCCVNGPSLPTCLVDAPLEFWAVRRGAAQVSASPRGIICYSLKCGGWGDLSWSPNVFQATSPKMSKNRARGRREHPVLPLKQATQWHNQRQTSSPGANVTNNTAKGPLKASCAVVHCYLIARPQTAPGSIWVYLKTVTPLHVSLAGFAPKLIYDRAECITQGGVSVQVINPRKFTRAVCRLHPFWLAGAHAVRVFRYFAPQSWMWVNGMEEWYPLGNKGL